MQSAKIIRVSGISLMFDLFMPDIICETVYDIDFDSLREKDIKGLIFDIDNTLVSYKRETPTENVVNLMNRLDGAGFAVCFVSNNNKQRVDIFNREFNYLSFPDAKKPLKKSMKSALEAMSLTNTGVAVIGDQIFTDVIAAKRIKAMSILVTPIEPVETLFFRFKRFFEKPLIRRYYKNKNKNNKSGGTEKTGNNYEI